MNPKEDGYPSENPKENDCEDQHDEVDGDAGVTPDDSTNAEERENAPDDPGVTRLTLDEIKRRAEERYGDLSPEEAEAQSLADLQNTWNRIHREIGVDVRGLANVSDSITGDIWGSIAQNMMPQIRLTKALDLSTRNPLMDALKDVMPSGPLTGIDFSGISTFRDISRMMPSGLPIPEVEADTSAGEERDDTADGALALPDSPDEVEGEARRIAREAPEFIGEVQVALYARSVSAQARMQKSIEQQSEDLRTILETMREQTASVHETAEAMNRQLEHMEDSAKSQHTQHQEAMKANRWSLRISAASVVVAAITLIVSIVVGCSQQNLPAEIEWQAPPASSTPSFSYEGAMPPLP